jgi:amidase
MAKNLSERINDASIRQLQKLQEGRVLSAKELTEYYIDRINETRDTINAVILVNPRAIQEAELLDLARSEGKKPGLLHGMPILIKDNIETLDMPTTAGSLYLKENHTGRDAPLVAKLREAGAIILGKTNLSEWANYRSTHSSSGWSAVGGQTRNPHDLSRSPCGSSSGSGAAVAANLAVAAIGTETSGSIICPASIMGVVGMKPTVGLVSRRHIVPISHTQDTAGPMTRTVEDAAILLSALAGYDPEDDATELIKAQEKFDYYNQLSSSGLKGIRVGVFKPNKSRMHYDTQLLFHDALKKLEENGAVLVDIDFTEPPYPEYRKDTHNIMQFEFKQGLNDYFRSLPGPLNQLTLEGLIEFNRQNAELEMPHFKQELLEQTLAVGDLHDPDYLASLERAQPFARKMIEELLEANDADLYVTLSADHSWPIDHVHGDWGTYSNSGIPAVAGYPHITVPMGKVKGLPVGISFIGRPLGEETLFRAAHSYEERPTHSPS